MRALLIDRLAEPPRLCGHEEPLAGEGERVLEVVAAPLNPVDISISRGGFFAGNPPLPYVPGVEAVGRSDDGALWFTCLEGLGVSRDGTLAERFVAREEALVAVPPSLDPAVAAALGTAGLAAWVPLTRRTQVRADDVVLVLAATGTVGMVAVQAAKLLGARHVVAVGRSAERLEAACELGADAMVQLSGQEDLAGEFTRACGGTAPTLVFDPLWGVPGVAAIQSAAPFARIIQLGAGAGADAVLPSAAIRGKALDILGYTNFRVPFAERNRAYGELTSHAQAGRIRVHLERVGLDDAVDAWRRQIEGGGKLVVCP